MGKDNRFYSGRPIEGDHEFQWEVEKFIRPPSAPKRIGQDIPKPVPLSEIYQTPLTEVEELSRQVKEIIKENK